MLPLHAPTLVSTRCKSSAPARCPVSCARLVATAAAAGDGWRAEQPEPSSSSASKGRSSAAWGSSWSRQAKNRRKRPKQSSDPSSKQPASQDDRDLDAAIRANVDRAAAMLDEIMQEVGQEVFMSEATAYLYDGPPDVTLQQAVHDAISRRIEWLDGNFLAATNAYVVAAEQQGNPQLQRVLATIRFEVLQQVAGRLPAAVQVLNAALAYPRRSHRLAVLLTSIAGGGRPVLADPAPSSSSSSSDGWTGSSMQAGGVTNEPESVSTSAATAGTTDGSSSSDNVRHGPAVPGATLEALAGSAMQLVDDMEDQEIIADRVLLARLVLLREELRAQSEKRRSASMMGSSSSSSSSSSTGQLGSKDADGGFFTYQRTNLPRRCAAFLKELLAVADRGRRLALMRKSFGEDWDFAGEPEQRRVHNEAPDVLRPGRFLSTLFSTKQELQQAYVEGKLAGQGHADGGARLLERLDDIELEALVVLDAMQAEGGNKGMPEGVQGSSESSIDEATDYKLPADPATA